jgi:branched-chain amino acid transport system substrate-binding protein
MIEARSMTNTRTRRALAPLAAVSALTLALVGCTRGSDDGGAGGGGEAASPGITDESVSLGISSPLSGPTASVGSCAVAGLYSYLEAGNADGGFEFGDGTTREVELRYLDDAYDPARAVANFRQLSSEGMFAYVGALGTPTNAAILPVANGEEIPQVLLQTGALEFSEDPDANPWTTGMLPTYYDEGRAFGEALVASGEPLTAALLAQNDDYGEGYVDGFTDAVEGSDVEIVASLTYEPTDTTLDGQVAELASTDADVLLSAVSVTPLMVGVLTRAQALGWLPRIFVPSTSSTPGTIIVPGGGEAFPAIYATTFSKTPVSPAVAEDEDVQEYLAAFEQYGSEITSTYTPQCAWGWIAGSILEQAFLAMEEPTRESLMTALRSIEDFDAPLLLDGVAVDTTVADGPAISDVTLVQYDPATQGYRPADAL